ncbi:MAG: polysaccharide biosynthesis tyrosine autokinase, partial [Armatimonadetes bacterium]|nr:polysaccharide biosynthesis tyrosine autokinase [Armatimonadota bacterium]
MEQVQQMQLSDYVRALARRWVFVLLFTLAVTLTGGIYSLTAPQRYVASARVLLRGEAPGLTVVFGQPRSDRFGSTGLSLDTYAKLMTSSETAKRVSQRLAARTSGQRIVVDPAEVVQSLRAITEPPDVLRVEAESPSPEHAIAIANEAADSFVSLVGDFQRAQETAARQFIEEQLRLTGDEIAQLTKQLQTLREAGNLAPEQLAVPLKAGGADYVNLLQRYTDQLTGLDSQIAAGQRQLAEVRAQLAKRRPFRLQKTQRENPLRAELDKQLIAYRSALADLTSRYTNDHPAVADTKARIAELEKLIATVPPLVESSTSAEDPAYDALNKRELELREQLAELRGQRSVVAAAVARLRQQARAGASIQQQTEDLQARLEMLREVQSRLVRELQVHKMNEAVKAEVAAVLDRAVVATSMTPQLSKTLLFSMLLGFVVSALLAVLLELMDDTIRDPDDLRRYTDLAYLGMVPQMDQIEDPLVFAADPRSSYAEAYRSVRSQMNFRLWEKPGKALLVTSALANEGKTLTLANIATAYAQAGQSVLVVDTDLRRPALHKLLGVSNDRGLTNAVVGEVPVEEVIYETRVPGLRLVPSGPLPPNPAELLESEAARAVLQKLADSADVVFFDTPPCLVISDAAVLAPLVDHVVLVLHSGQVTARELRQAKETLEAGRASILGVVL